MIKRVIFESWPASVEWSTNPNVWWNHELFRRLNNFVNLFQNSTLNVATHFQMKSDAPFLCRLRWKLCLRISGVNEISRKSIAGRVCTSLYVAITEWCYRVHWFSSYLFLKGFTYSVSFENWKIYEYQLLYNPIIIKVHSQRDSL